MATHTAKKQHLSDDATNPYDDGGFIAQVEVVQDKLDQLTDQRSEEILAIERRYNEIRRPIYLERNKLMRQVPDFWVQCLLQHPQISEVIPDSDTDIFTYLEEIDVEDSANIKSGYTITFTFREDNPYFRNRQLVKQLVYAENNNLEVRCTDIDWTDEGAEHMEKAEQELVNGRKRKAEDLQSFFSWFWVSGEIREGSDPISDLIKEELWSNPIIPREYYGNGDDDLESDEGVAGDLDGVDEDAYTAEDLEGLEVFPDEDMEGAPENESGGPGDVGAEGDDDDNEQAQAASDYLEDEATAGEEDEEPNPTGVVVSAGSAEGQQHIQEAAAEALADATGEVALTADA